MVYTNPGASAINSAASAAPITDAQVAHARLHKQGHGHAATGGQQHRPLGRTQSAPLPLGHPMLAGGGGPQHMDQSHYKQQDGGGGGSGEAAELQAYEHQHALLTAKIRQTVLSRAAMKMPEHAEHEEDAARQREQQEMREQQLQNPDQV